MRNIIVRHGKDGKLGNGTVTSNNTTGTFVNGGKIRVHVTGVTTTPRNFFTGGRHLTQSISIGRHVRKNDQHVQVTFVSKVLSRSERKTGCDDTFNGWIVGKIQEKSRTLHGTTFLEIGTEETSSFHVNTHSTKHNTKVILVSINSILLLDKRRLTSNLSSDFVVGKTSCRENGNLLSTSNGVHHIDSRDTSLDHSLGIITRRGVNGLSINVKVSLSKNSWSRINDLSRTIE
mmetsp:Transcript_3276/g.6039  ORF Transcript_3276/g.6039 Transcript_3276/m.6039 type:complete len:232 (+) Transcript_3276:569-1264(+)